MAIRLLIVDDHSVVRQGIIALLEDEEDIDIVGEAGDGDEVAEAIIRYSPDVILLDITMPRMSGTEVMQWMPARFPEVKILIFSMHNNPDYILAAVHYGASGYLQKDTSRAEILRAVRSVAKGELYFPPKVSSIIIQNLVKNGNHGAKPNLVGIEEKNGESVWKKITSREQQILECLIEGMSSKDIAERFELSTNTVANQRASIIKKANVKNTAELVSLALREKSRV
ncbi:Oxygen regulatory protein NreC [Dyadobacter sp. CECT 9275]|uniref:Oxygen regulatory protein NreC n=1 Tax=Dyadobacter helix TaxID=2822344 RepID=A0A916NJV8_9BACT|nr:response regulator transcription factor [Dyadobacter sp. CECT 9275]CAG4991395.1 Oxygen regulatory protein NreC [Dyadobacter sp. CECT 9275]